LILRISAFDPHLTMPSMAIVSLNVNIPPKISGIDVSIESGRALFDKFNITVNGAVTSNTNSAL
jgi:hypothetical protein